MICDRLVERPGVGGARGDFASRARGYSLIEMLLVVAIAGVLLGLGVPAFSGVVRDARLSTASSTLHAALFLARSEAIKRGRRVSLCTSLDQSTCAPGVGWHAGWVVFEDASGNGLREPGEVVVSVGSPQSGGVAMTGNAPVRSYVSYVPSGMTRLAGGGLQMGTITVCSNGVGRQIVISATGRPRVVSNANCI